MEKLIQSEWYEVAVSYIEEGTETIESFKTLEQAKRFANKYDMDKDIEFLFIDKWKFNYDTLQSDKVSDFNSLIYKYSEYYSEYLQNK